MRSGSRRATAPTARNPSNKWAGWTFAWPRLVRRIAAAELNRVETKKARVENAGPAIQPTSPIRIATMPIASIRIAPAPYRHRRRQ